MKAQSGFYRLMARLSRFFGLWVMSLAARVIAVWYFFFLPSRRAESIRLYRALFPEKGGFHAWRLAWLQFQHFTTVYVDRLLMDGGRSLSYTSEGREYFEQALEEGKGVVFLMSHLGQWEMASRFLARRGKPILLYMGKKAGEDFDRLMKRDLMADGVRIVAVDAGGGSPTDGLEALATLRKGGVVSLAGDRLWAGERKVEVEFLGHRVDLPAAPHAMALVSGAPVLTFFVFRQGRGRHHVVVHPPHRVTAPARSDRDRAIRESAQAYADSLAQTLRRYPVEWHAFERFLGDRLPPAGKK